jgi:aquaporin Z
MVAETQLFDFWAARYWRAVQFSREAALHPIPVRGGSPAVPRGDAEGQSPSGHKGLTGATHGLEGLSNSLQRHWPEYLMEGALLALFMISACFFASLLWHPASPVRQAIPSPELRRVLMGLAMGTTAVSLIYSPWGKQSGAHMNPATTLTFFRLGKVARWDALLYVFAQFAGGISGVAVASAILGQIVAHPDVNYAVTAGRFGVGVAFAAEVAISFLLMTMVLNVSNRPQLARFTGLFAGLLVWTYIVLEDPLSGMSMNPARTFGSAIHAHLWTALWVYFTAPPVGMLLAAELYVRRNGLRRVFCAKFHHHNDKRCIFRCNWAAAVAESARNGGA